MRLPARPRAEFADRTGRESGSPARTSPSAVHRGATRCRERLPSREGERARRRHLHRFVHLRRARVERAAEDEREAEDVVDLVRIVAAPGRDDRVAGAPRGPRREVSPAPGWPARRRSGLGAIVAIISPRDGSRDRKSDEDVRAHERIGDSARVGFSWRSAPCTGPSRPARPL